MTQNSDFAWLNLKTPNLNKLFGVLPSKDVVGFIDETILMFPFTETGKIFDCAGMYTELLTQI